jgi:hypothetical protein
MRSAIVKATACGIILGFASLDAWSQLTPDPPAGALWEEQANGDAIQKDLGFILPKKWKTFEREGFTSTRADGASTKVHYLSDDKAIRLGILLQLRADIRGLDLGSDFVWQLAQLSGEAEYIGRAAERPKPTELSAADFSLGKRLPAGRMRWARYDLSTGPEIQGVWWQNIGVWSVIVTMTGPEGRKADIEAAANTLLTEMPFPSAPIVVEFAAIGPKLFGSMQKCSAERPKGTGEETVPTFKEAAALGMLLPAPMLNKAGDIVITPVTHAQDYCVIETFYPRKDLPVTAVQYTGAGTADWEGRYGFALNNGRGGYYQIERMKATASLSAITGADASHVYLDYSNNQRASVYTVFSDWPSYEVAKQIISTMHADEKKKPEPVITMTNPAEKILVVTNRERIQKVEGEGENAQ